MRRSLSDGCRCPALSRWREDQKPALLVAQAVRRVVSAASVYCSGETEAVAWLTHHSSTLPTGERKLKAASIYTLRHMSGLLQRRPSNALAMRSERLKPSAPRRVAKRLEVPLCGGEGCQAPTHLSRSGLSHRNATSLRFKPSSHRRVAKRMEVPAVLRRRLPSNNPPQPLGLIPPECCQLYRPFSLGYFSFGPAKEK